MRIMAAKQIAPTRVPINRNGLRFLILSEISGIATQPIIPANIRAVEMVLPSAIGIL